ncbi:putative non-specific serine/threonine protein kinase [Medicago truncatula]|uniref:Putative non-specific serine/threonine protein kinase n=1 Tax=Medicago truncatula TaxID=3880 RepID=A0A396JJJ8_MEDTR|nr:putative non-specific serine/threonine protein kinase [Medicago truncatula]
MTGLLLFFCVFVMVTSPHADAKNQGNEADALLKWKASFDKQSKEILSSWIGNNPCSSIGLSWEGIICDNNSKSINKIDLTSFELKGTLQSLNFSSLPKIQKLVLRNNFFYGVIPYHIGVMSNLNTLDFSQNYLYGSIPNSIGNLSKLSHIDLSENDISGIIPFEIGRLRNLTILDFHSCNLYTNFNRNVGQYINSIVI